MRNQVRKEMGLESSDFLIISLSSINPGKGQLMMLQAALMVAEGIEDEGLEGLARIEKEGYIGAGIGASQILYFLFTKFYSQRTSLF